MGDLIGEKKAGKHGRTLHSVVVRIPLNLRGNQTRFILRRIAICFAAFDLAGSCVAQEIRWLPVGPSPQTVEDGTLVSGRVMSIAISPNFDGHGNAAMFLGTNGGVWRSSTFTASAPTWQPLTDQLNVPIRNRAGLLTIYSLAVDPNNPDRIFASAGDPGKGVLRSLDGGNTWTLMGNSTFSSAGAYPISKIVVDPTDKSGSTVYVAGGPAGFYKSTDGGVTWTSMVSGLPTSFRVSDLDYTVGASNALSLYIALSYASDAQDKGVWASIDGALSWNHLRVNLVDLDTNQPATSSAIGITKLAADHRPGAPLGVFAAMGNATTRFLLNIYRFADANSPGIVASGNLPSPKKVFNQDVNLPISVSPSGSVYLGTAAHILPFVSVDSGAHWQQLQTGSNNTTPHVDDWAWAFWGNDVYSGNDGGIWRFDSAAKNWSSLNTLGLQTNMVNSVSSHPVYPNVILIGSQDNETAMRLNGSWKSVTGGPADGGEVLFDPTPTNINNYAYTNGPPDPNPNFLFRMDGLNATNWKSIGFFNDNLVPFYSLFSIVPSDTKQLLVPLGQVFRTPDRGASWGAISPAFVSKQTPANAIANSTDGKTIYVAYGNQLFRTVNGGGDASAINWPKVNVSFNDTITSIAVNPDDANNVVVGSASGEIWQTTNGNTWSNIAGNFPNARINAIAIKTDTGSGGSTIFLGTTVGVFNLSVSPPRGPYDWEIFGDGFPVGVNVTGLIYNPRTKYLVAGTYGRGVFAAYLHFTTMFSLGATSVRNQLFVFGSENSGDIQVNQATLGNAFSGWFDVEGEGHSNAAPAPAVVSNTVFCFVKGLDNQIYLNQADIGKPFGNWFLVPGRKLTDCAPSATASNNTLYVFAKGLDEKIYLNQADLGHAFGNWFEVQGNGQTDRSPSAASTSKTIFLFIKGLDNRVYLNQADVGKAFGNWFPVPGGQTTDQSPAATIVAQSIFVFIKGLNGHIYLNQAPLGKAFSGWFEVQGGMQTDQAPVAVSVGNTVFVFVKGLDDRIYVNQADFGSAFGAWFEVGGGLQ